MEKLKELTKAFDNIEVSEEQENAIREFFSLFEENVKEKVEAEFEQKIEALNEEIEKAKNGSGASTEDAEKALEVLREDAEKAFELFKADAEQAANLMLEDVKEEHAKQLAEALDKLYEDVEVRATEDFKSSKEFAALVNVIKAVRPVVATDDNKALLEEIEKLRAENEALKSDNGDLSKKDIISGLVEGFSEEHKKTMIEFMEAAKTEEEIYERFNAIASIIEGETSAEGAPKKNKFKRKKAEEAAEKKEEKLEEAAPLISSTSKKEEQTIVNEETHAEMLGANLPGLSKIQQQGLAYLLHARQAR